jgi:phosphoglycolate phosphatase
MQLRPVVFDLDGTLVDSKQDIVVAANHVRQKAGLEPLPDAVVAGYVGDGARYLVASVLGLDLGDAAVSPHLDVFLDYYTDHAVDFTTLMPGVLEVLARLPGRRLAVCTNKSRRTTLAVLDGLGIAERFDAIVAGGDTPKNKPSADPLLKMAELLDVSAERLIMVGDGPQDILAARAVGAYGVGVRGGILPFERLAASNPDVVLGDLSELPALIERLDPA